MQVTLLNDSRAFHNFDVAIDRPMYVRRLPSETGAQTFYGYICTLLNCWEYIRDNASHPR